MDKIADTCDRSTTFPYNGLTAEYPPPRGTESLNAMGCPLPRHGAPQSHGLPITQGHRSSILHFPMHPRPSILGASRTRLCLPECKAEGVWLPAWHMPSTPAPVFCMPHQILLYRCNGKSCSSEPQIHSFVKVVAGRIRR